MRKSFTPIIVVTVILGTSLALGAPVPAASICAKVQAQYPDANITLAFPDSRDKYHCHKMSTKRGRATFTHYVLNDELQGAR